MNWNQLGKIVDVLYAESDRHLAMINGKHTPDDFVIHMTTANVLHGLARAYAEARFLTPVEFPLAAERNLSSSEGDPQPS